MKSFADLIDGYRNFRTGAWSTQRERWSELAEGQAPQVMVIACSDSRVDPTQIFDADPGEIFVVRNVAAMVPPFETTPGNHGVSAALEFAVQFLNVREIVVMGHGLCGGCKAALTQDLHGTEPGRGGFIANWIAMLDDVRDPIAAELGTEGRTAERAMEQAAVKFRRRRRTEASSCMVRSLPFPTACSTFSTKPPANSSLPSKRLRRPPRAPM